MQENNFYKILNNTATDSEKDEFFNSLENDSPKKDEFQHYKNLYVLSNINRENYSQQQHKSFSRFWSSLHPVKTKNVIFRWMSYAAIFLVASAMGFMTNYILNSDKLTEISQHIEYSSEKGSVSIIHLEDGSSIWLSSGTKMTIDKGQDGELIAKLNGEAYFDLLPNTNRKFIVDLEQFKVRDIGTRFNLRAYKSEHLISVSLVKGQIDLIDNHEKSILTIKPGEFIEYDKTNHGFAVLQQDPTIVTAWKDGKFVFINKTLAEICKELENWYNVEIHIDDPELAKTRYTSVVKRSTTVKMVLKILTMTDHIHYDITDEEEGKDLVKIWK